MTFQTKDFRSIVASLINLFRANQDKVTDLSVGSVARTMMEAPAAEIEQLYMQMLLGLQEAIPVAIYRAFNFQRLVAGPASGVMQINVALSAIDTVVPANSAFTVIGQTIQYRTQVDLIIPAGSTVGAALVICAETGPNGNIDADNAFTLVSSFSGFVSATNPAPFTGGTGIETDDQRQQRFASFILSLARSTIAGIKYGISLAKLTDQFNEVTEAVRYSLVVEPYLADNTQPVGWIQIYIHNGVDGASLELIARTAEILYGYYNSDGTAVPGYKAAGVKVDVIAASSLVVDVSAIVAMLPGFDLSSVHQRIVNEVSSYLLSLDIGAKAIHAEIVAIIMNVPGVYNTTVSLPAGDITPTSTQKIMPGNVGLGNVRPGAGSLTLTGLAPVVTQP